MNSKCSIISKMSVTMKSFIPYLVITVQDGYQYMSVYEWYSYHREVITRYKV